jgi:peptidylprolyl isomerase
MFFVLFFLKKNVTCQNSSFGLYDDESPKAVENFKCLCTGEKGELKNGTPKCYKGSTMHRIEPGFVVQGGDYTRGDGSGGQSIWSKPFNDDKKGLTLKHSKKGILSMANPGKIFITKM